MNSVTLFSILYCTITAYVLWADSKAHLDFLERDLFDTGPTALWRPLAWLPYPKLQSNRLKHCQRLLISSLSLTAALLSFSTQVWAARALLSVAAWLSLIYFGHVRNFPTLRRKSNHIPIILFLLSICPALGSSICNWLWLLPVQCLVVQAYFSSAICKLRNSGLSWCNGESLRVYLLENYLLQNTNRAMTLAQRPMLCAMASCAVLFWELSFPAVLVIPKLVPAYLLFGLAFHGATKILMRIDYLRYFGASYLSFVLPLFG